jgi:hypothetical protein
MLFQQRLQELTSFIKAIGEDTGGPITDIVGHIEMWGKSVAEELGLPILPNSTIGVSFDTDMVLEKIPEWGIIETGFYRFSFSKPDILVEVINQDLSTGTVYFTGFPDVNTGKIGKIDSMSYSAFQYLFDKA